MNETLRNKRDYGLVIAISLLGIGLLAVFFPFGLLDGTELWGYRIEIGKYNELGEFISGITSPFLSIAAFLLLYLTYSTQKKELVETKSILFKQTKINEKQQFENTFFNLINLHNEIIKQFEIEITKTTKSSGEKKERYYSIKGRDCFDYYYKRFRYSFAQIHPKLIINTELTKTDKIGVVYKEFFREYGATLGHYFRNLYNIVKFVDNSQVEDKKLYTNIIRAQLSSDELLLLALNCLSEYGREKFKPLVEKYSLLKTISDNDELLRYELKELYSANAFN